MELNQFISRGRRRIGTVVTLGLFAISTSLGAYAQDKKPNILVIWGDDIGESQISAFTRGMMGYKTPT